MSFGRTELRINVFGAKFDVESDFEVRLAVAPQKPDQKSEKQKIKSEMLPEKFCLVPKNEMLEIVWNAFWQILTALRALFEGSTAIQSFGFFFVIFFVN